jgi:hypothetical protein
METEKTYWYDLKINDDNKGFIYGINYIDNDEIIECEWFKTKQERNKKIKKWGINENIKNRQSGCF